MEHRLIREVEEALGWSGPEPLGEQFARGSIAHPDVLERLLTPNRLLDMVMRRSLTNPQFRCRGGCSCTLSNLTAAPMTEIMMVGWRHCGRREPDGFRSAG
ncbi:hypothetical protein Stube_09540 [Streptomyces tubercidicus]|uniref:Uncharacterized protein n=1 Tax=Streptomyces tubercidicus TaxID=47759 RepID=A0A640UNN9_9ACTN|nr:hypothetical protein Stube_09540 [Streptomyces tubercidicus]